MLNNGEPLKAFAYPGRKHHLLPYLPQRITGRAVELFGGSAAWAYNVRASDGVVVYEQDPNVVAIHTAIKRYDVFAFSKFILWVEKTFKINKADGYQLFRAWYNDVLWSQNHPMTGIGTLLLAGAATNGWFRFSSKGFNQTCGLRQRSWEANEYNALHNKAQNIEFRCDDARNHKIRKTDHVFMDPPYIDNPIETYGKAFAAKDLRDLLDACGRCPTWYSDTWNKVNRKLDKKQWRTLYEQKMNKKKNSDSGNDELLLTNTNPQEPWDSTFMVNKRVISKAG